MSPAAPSNCGARRRTRCAPGALLLALAFTACAGEADSGGPGVLDMSSGPSIWIGDAEDLRSMLAEGEARGTLVNFWATWCMPCVAEMPELAEVGREYAELGLRVVAVSTDYVVPGQAPSPSEVALFAGERGWGLELFYFEDPEFEILDGAFDLPGPIPVTLALDAAGTEVDRVESAAGRARFEELARAALGL